jgi:hypothetical protein
MNDVPLLEHALYGGQDAGGYRFLAQSSGFREEWLPEAERFCTGFGERPAGVACPRAIFAHPFSKDSVAVVQVADQGADDQGRPGALAFHLVIVPHRLYLALGGDPFYLADQLPPPWSARGHLPALPCPAPAPQRRVEDILQVLNVEYSSTLLGGVQALLDGGRLVFERTALDDKLLRGIWLLLPTASRGDFWPASFAFSNALGFHALAQPRIDPEQCAGYLREEQAGDYPEGKYELELQTAAEHGDQETLDYLFARRSYREIRRIALLLLFVVILLPITIGLLQHEGKEENQQPKPPDKQEERVIDVSQLGGNVPLNPRETQALGNRLTALAEQLKVQPPSMAAGPALFLGTRNPLGATGLLLLERGQWTSKEALLLDAIDRKLGTPDPERSGPPLRNAGPIERQLRVLLYKHGVERYRDLSLSPIELVERLEAKLNAEKKP